MKQIQRIATTFIMVLLIPLSQTSAQEIGDYIEQFEGRIGGHSFKIKLLRIGEKTDEEVLIQVSGVDDPVDGFIYKCKKEWKNREKSLNKYRYATTQIPGKEKFNLFHSDSFYGRQLFAIYLTNAPRKAIEVYPTTQQEDLDPLAMYRQYLDQQKQTIIQ